MCFVLCCLIINHFIKICFERCYIYYSSVLLLLIIITFYMAFFCINFRLHHCHCRSWQNDDDILIITMNDNGVIVSRLNRPVIMTRNTYALNHTSHRQSVCVDCILDENYFQTDPPKSAWINWTNVNISVVKFFPFRHFVSA